VQGLGAEVIIGDLTRSETVAAALQGVSRMYFATPVSPDHLLAATVVASVAKEYGKLEALVDLSQMTVSQMTATSTEESHQQRLHWLAEQVLNWSGLPVVHIRPTAFLDTPLFTTLAARSIQENGTIALPFGTGRTSPVAVDDVARRQRVAGGRSPCRILRQRDAAGGMSRRRRHSAAHYEGRLRHQERRSEPALSR
jgi:uncharacterized protein YbjT (DUF2867 family)